MHLGNPRGWVGAQVYVTLAVEDGYGRAVAVSPLRPETLAIYGKIIGASDTDISLEYGIEHYFVPEGKGRLIERDRRDDLDARVSIDRYGTAVLKSLVVGGQDVSFQ
jgi:uncharacterized membrane-anchored protein